MLKLNRILFLLLSASVPFILPSCNIFDPPVTVPIYGHIDSIHFNVPVDSAIKQGSASANIGYAWVYMDDNPVGAFQLPCTFPIVGSSGTHNIKIYSGIIAANGNSAVSINPFYQYYSINMNMLQGNKYTFHPVSNYYPWVVFPYKENFDNETPGSQPTGISTYRGSFGRSDTVMIATASPSLVFQGKCSGMVVVDAGHKYYIGVTTPSDSLPTNGNPVYLELNYKATTEFTIGVFDGNEVNFIAPSALVLPTSTWKKMYVSLNNTIQTFRLERYNIYFAFARDTINNHVADTLLLDNIKIDD